MAKVPKESFPPNTCVDVDQLENHYAVTSLIYLSMWQQTYYHIRGDFGEKLSHLKKSFGKDILRGFGAIWLSEFTHIIVYSVRSCINLYLYRVGLLSKKDIFWFKQLSPKNSASPHISTLPSLYQPVLPSILERVAHTTSFPVKYRSTRTDQPTLQGLPGSSQSLPAVESRDSAQRFSGV